MKIQMNVLFKMMQRDDKKEVLKFQVQGDEDVRNELYELAGDIISFEIEGCAAGEVAAEFINIQRDSKKTVMKFGLKGDIENSKAYEIYKFSGRNVTLFVQPSQMSMEEFQEPHEGIEYSVNNDGTVEVDENQAEIDWENDALEGVQ